MQLLGREHERRMIDDLLRCAREDRSGALVLRGEPGIGKSALLAYAAEQASDMHVLRCIGIESEHEMPFAGMHQLLRPCLDLIARLPPPQQAALNGALGLSFERVEDRFLVSLGALSLLAEACEEQAPMLCLIDDAQWLDGPSQEALTFAARRLEAEPIAILIAAREGDPRQFESPGLDEHHLAPLGDDDARALLQTRIERPASPGVVQSLVENANGNPLALLELPGGLTPDQIAGSEPIVGPPLARGAVERTFRARVEALPDRARHALLIAATDDSGDMTALRRAGEALGTAVPEDLDAAKEAGLVEVNGRISFRHPLVRSAVYRSASRAERKAAHEALADAFDDPVRSVWHRAAVVERADEGVAAELEAGGAQAAARGAHATASVAFERAAELSGEDSRRGRRLAAAAQAALDAGRADTAIALVERARPLVDEPFERAHLNMMRAIDASRRGSPAEASERLMETGPAVASTNPEMATIMILWGFFLSIQAGAGARTAGAAREALASVAPAGDIGKFGRAVMDGVAAALADRGHDAHRHFDDAQAVARGFREPLKVGMAIFPCLLGGDPPGTYVMAARAVADNRERGSLTGLTGMLPVYAQTQVAIRRLGAAESSVAEGLVLTRQLGCENDETSLYSIQARVDALRGRESECRANAELGMRRGLANGVGWAVHVARIALGELELGLGNAREALEHFDQLDYGTVPPLSLMTTPDAIDAAVRLGETDRARRDLARFASWSPVSATPYIDGMIVRCSAILADDSEQAESLFKQALELHSHDTPPYERARTQLAYGEFLRRERRRVEARVQLGTALQAFEGIGATAWAERALGELRATGETARKRDVSTLDQLTPQELRVARLVAAGATNRDVGSQLFVSPKTVEYHLRKVFVKLGVGSRVELARLPLGEPD